MNAPMFRVTFTRPHRLLAIAVAIGSTFASGACLAPDSDDLGRRDQALIGGAIDEGDPAVLSLTVPGRESFCTGTLISPSVVATAAHCIDDAGSNPSITAFFGTSVSGDGRKVSVMSTRPHPMWNGELSGGHDIGLMMLAFPQDPALPVPLNRSPITNHIGDTVRRVGFGTYTVEGAYDSTKRVGTTTITRTQGTDVFIAGDNNLSTCSGDSGGPVLMMLDGQEVLAGVHSFGSQINGQCIPGNDGDTRVDIYADSFVTPWVQMNDPACGQDGLCAYIGCTDDPDCTPCGADGTCVQDCPLPDPDCPTQALGELCQANAQCLTGLCVYWSGDVKTKFCSEPCDKQNDTCPTAMSCQAIPTFGDICYYDEAPAGVLGDSCTADTDCGSYNCEAGTCVYACNLSLGRNCPSDFECRASGAEYYCFAIEGEESGGCSAGGSPSGAPVAGVIFLALVAVSRRRRAPR